MITKECWEFLFQRLMRGGLRGDTVNLEVQNSQGAWWPLGRIPTNLYLSVSTVTVPSWRCGFLSWRVEMYPQNINVPGWCFLFMLRVCKLWSHCSHCKHDLHDYHGALWWIPCPLLPWDDDDSHWSRHQHYILNDIIDGNRKKHQSLLLKGIGSGPGPSSPPRGIIFVNFVINPSFTIFFFTKI